MATVAALGFMGFNLANVIIANAMGNQARAEVIGEAPIDAFEGFEAFTSGDSSYDVGVNVYGKVIFVDNAAALKTTKVKCAKAIEVMRSQAPELRRFKPGNIYIYSNYIWQINWDGVDQDVFLQKQFLSLFLEYYIYGDPHQDVY